MGGEGGVGGVREKKVVEDWGGGGDFENMPTWVFGGRGEDMFRLYCQREGDVSGTK